MLPPDTPSPPGTEFWANNPARWLAAIVDSSDDAIIGKTLDSVIRSWNGGATRVFGYTAEEARGQSVLILIPPDRQYEETEIVARLSRGERIDHFETVRMRKDGTLIDVSLSVSPIRDDQGNIVGAAKIARDVTESNRLRRAERELSELLQEQAAELEQQIEEAQSLQEELEQTNDELHQSLETSRVAQQHAEQANRAKSVFLATMSHELRTPLNAIAGYVDLLDLGIRGELSQPQRADLARIKQNQETLLRLIEDVLDLAKLESGRIEFRICDVKIDEVLRTLETFVAPSLQKKGLAYAFEPCGDGVVARADRHKVEQIMLNLLSNAVKFTERGRIAVRCMTRDHTVEIEVADTGTGIRRDLLDKIFEPFVQGDQELTRSAEGTGLGLSISRQLARGMGGDVLASSEYGAGSTFTLVLPKAKAGAATG
ncbi:MAG TPA: ATP-binding protein [Gemmatimonadaceae bacterium]|nr:ATP-binding protein [Gemmatimonadaceae bacterium]